MPIKKEINLMRSKQQQMRMIESADKRIVHFLFNPKVPIKETPFAKHYKRLLDGTLEELGNEENEKF